MSEVPLYDPQSFDVFMNTPGHNEDALLARLPQTPLGRVRRAQLLFSRGEAALLPELAEELTIIDAPPARGVGLLVQTTLRLYEEVLSANPDPRGCLPLDLEDSCHAHAALGVAAAQTGQLQRALEHLRVALTLSRSLALRYRSQMLELEWLRVRSLAGDPEPDEVSLLLMQPMPPRRRRWGQRTHAEALMALGAYRDALRALGTLDQDHPLDAGLREWLHALCLLPPARRADDPLLTSESPYLTLTLALRQLWTGDRRVDVTGVQGEPQATYAGFIEAAALVRSPKLAAAAGARLGSAPPPRADQAVTWGLMRLGAAVDGASEVDLLAASRAVEQGLTRLRTPDDLMRVLRVLAPERIMLLSLGPFGEQLRVSGLPAQPVLVGQTVIYGGQEIRLPGRTGRTLVLEAAQIAERDELFGTERRRLAEALVAFGGRQVVNMGWVLRGCGLLSLAAQKAGDDAAHAGWRSATRAAFELLSADVQSVLYRHPPAYLPLP